MSNFSKMFLIKLHFLWSTMSTLAERWQWLVLDLMSCILQHEKHCCNTIKATLNYWTFWSFEISLPFIPIATTTITNLHVFGSTTYSQESPRAAQLILGNKSFFLIFVRGSLHPGLFIFHPYYPSQILLLFWKLICASIFWTPVTIIFFKINLISVLNIFAWTQQTSLFYNDNV